MPPKGSQKPKSEQVKAEPAKIAPAKKAPAKTPAAKATAAKAVKPATPKKAAPAKPPVVHKTLLRDAGDPIPIDVTYEGESRVAKLRETGDYLHNLHLTAQGAFSLEKTVVFTSGEYEGLQAILLRPAKVFPFLKLPKEARVRVYAIYFANKGILNEEIVLEGKRKESRDIYAKSYADGSKNRVALLAVNSEVYDEAISVFYANTIKLETTSTLVEFWAQIPHSIRARLTSVSIKSFVKTTSRHAMQFLAEAGNIKRLHIEAGVSSDDDPAKAAKAFFADASKFLEAVAATKKGDKHAAVEVLSFGPQALTTKNASKDTIPWSEEMVEEFREVLEAKMK